MDKYIIVNLNMFAVENQVLIAVVGQETESIGSYSIQSLPAIVSTLAHERDIYNVKIIGGSKYAQLIEFGIESAESAKYNENKIEIEVI